MKKLIIHPTDMSQWHALVNEAQLLRSCTLAEDLESYLVFLLMRFASQPKVVSSVLAIDFLDIANTSGQERNDRLRELGDKSLLFSGLFPGIAQKKQVNLNYFIDIGQSAYGTLSSVSEQNIADLFAALREDFLTLMDVLQAMRELSHDKLVPLPETILDLSQTLPREKFLNVLRRYTDKLIVFPNSKHDDKH